MKKQLLSLLFALSACLSVPMLAVKYTEENYEWDENYYDDMPALREVGTVDSTLSWTTPNTRISVHLNDGPPRLATSHLADALYLAMGYRNGRIEIQNMETGKYLEKSLLKQACEVKSMAFSPEDPHVLAIAGQDRTLKSIDVQTGDVLTTFDTSDASGAQIAFDCFGSVRPGDNVGGCLFPAGGISFSADGNFLMSELKQNNIQDYKTPLYGIWDAETGAFIGKYKDITFFGDNESVLANGSWCNNMIDPNDKDKNLDEYRYAISPHSKKMAVIKKSTIYLYSLKHGKKTFLQTLETNPKRGDYNYAISFSPDGTHLAVSGCMESNDKTMIEVWDTQSGNKIKEIIVPCTFLYGVQFSPDNQKLLYGCRKNWNEYSIETKNLAAVIDNRF